VTDASSDLPPVPRPMGAGTLVFATLVLCSAFGEVSTGLLVPAMPTLGGLFGATPATVQLTIVAFAVAFATGQLVFGPLSDRRGRRTPLLIGAALALAGSLAAAMAGDLWTIVAARSVQGLGAAAGYVVARAIVRDVYGAEGSAAAMALLFALMSACFLLAPLAGGMLLDLAGWRAGFTVAALAAAVWGASAFLIVPETATARPGPGAEAVHRVYLGLFAHRGFLAHMIVHAIAYASLYGFVAGAPFLLIEGRGLAPSGYGALAVLAMSGFFTGAMAVRIAIPRWGRDRAIAVSLAIMLAAPAVLVGAGLMGFDSTPVVIALQFAVWFGGGLLAPNTASGVMMSHPKAAGASAAVLGFVQMLAAAAAALIQGLIYDGTVFPMAGLQLLLGVAAWTVWRRLRPDGP
jgi:DHA1 family bicyclomycin/chloramphenicol resistance-like MFS transporter